MIKIHHVHGARLKFQDESESNNITLGSDIKFLDLIRSSNLKLSFPRSCIIEQRKGIIKKMVFYDRRISETLDAGRYFSKSPFVQIMGSSGALFVSNDLGRSHRKETHKYYTLKLLLFSFIFLRRYKNVREWKRNEGLKKYVIL